ncbi:MAG: hypothetical protein IT293_18880 [Deltaproteobacteria bacterium]|nr:hypothetical protein [Deltaproteobacteria bacterium]
MVRPDDEEPTADELREAEELARLLEGDDVGDRAFDARAPELEAASLLRYSQGAGELEPEREDAILRDLLVEAERNAQPAAAAAAAAKRATGEKRFDWGRAIRWLLGIGGVAAAAAIVLLVVRPWRPDATDVATRLPAPSIELLRAQASAASSGGSMAGLSDAMRGYRTGVFDALRSRYAGSSSAEVTVTEAYERYACEGLDEAPSGALASIETPRRRVSRPRSRRDARPAALLAHAWVERFTK